MTRRGVRDKILTLQRKQKAKLNKDRSVTGLGGEEPPEFELLIVEISDDTEANLYMRRTTKKKFQIMQKKQH